MIEVVNYRNHRVPPPLAERLEAKSIPEPNSGCWLWLAGVNAAGYGMIMFDRAYMVASRASWLAYRGAIPARLLVCHRCDNRACVNPDHLFLGTHKQNSADMVAKGRHKRGPRISKLTAAQAREIFISDSSHSLLARRYGVSASTVQAIKQGRNWKRETGAVGAPCIGG